MKTLLIKEWKEQLRTGRFWIMMAVFVFFAILSPLTARYMPEIISSISQQQQIEIQIPEPTWTDSVAQYVKNISQICTFIIILLFMGIVVKEKETGTAVFVVVKPVSRNYFILSKVIVSFLVSLTALSVAFLLASAYTLLFFGEFPFLRFGFGNALILLYLWVIISTTIFFSTVARTQVMAAIFSFLLWLAMGLLAQIDGIGVFIPAKLISLSMTYSVSGELSWQALSGALFFLALFIFLSVFSFRKWEPS
ncbi:MAG TPA: ABC transporter permease subunit [Bacteroidia bacterium]|nr:ABC transporter permease subunit [Bacteroidia bacterium]HRS58632.1 ABC transporter permease subunit [Bacteroidia bacterium]HRU67839.1 ABC transporter permease subunit [Bacteroidia bacterium]